MQSQAGQSGTSNQVSEQVAPVPALPQPTIVWVNPQAAGDPCTNGTSVPTYGIVVGQRIAIRGCVPLGVQGVQSEQWTPTVPPGTAVAGYTPGGSGQPVSATACPSQPPAVPEGTYQSCDFTPFYWVDPGNQGQGFSFQFRYTANGQTSLPATATFPIIGTVTSNGAGSTFFSADMGAVQVFPPGQGGNGKEN
jgi:hypothetical protein